MNETTKQQELEQDVESHNTQNTKQKQDEKNNNNKTTNKNRRREQEETQSEQSNRAKNKSKTTNAWAALFNKAREKRQEILIKQERQRHTSIQPTVRNKINNISYGDRCDTNWLGNFRVYFQNVNGLSIGKHTRKWDNILTK